jgi:hypothetical protein
MRSTDVAQISVIVEFIGGKITDMLLKMISLYRPDCKSSTRDKVAKLTSYTALIVGTKGTRSKLQTWGKALGGEISFL